MTCILKRPGERAQITQVDNTLEALQAAVGGYIETVSFASNACVICNEEGRLLGLPYCTTFLGLDFYGPILLVGVNGERFCGLSVQTTAFLMGGLADG